MDTTTTTVIDTIAVSNGPKGLVVSPDGTRVYVANGIDSTVSVISV